MPRVTSQPTPRRRFLGWDTVVGGAGLQLLQSALFYQSFGVYVVVWSEELGWSRGAIAGGYALVTFLGGVLGPPQGWALERFGVRRVILLGLVTQAAGLGSLSFIDSLHGFYAAMLLTGLGLAASGFLSITTAVVPWFVQRRSTALSLMAIGLSLGGLLVPLVAGAVVDVGWRETLRASAALVLLAGLPLAVLMRRHPSAYGQLPDGGYAGFPDRRAGGVELRRRDPSADHTLREALRTRAFWLLGAGHGGALLVMSGVSVHLVPHLHGGVGHPLQLAAGAVALVTLTSAAGQLVGGPLGDRFDKRLIAIVAMLAHGLALLVLAWGPGWGAVVTFAIVHGVAWGVRGPLMGSLRADYFGASHFGSIMGASMLVFMAGQLIGPILLGALADLFGDYRLGFSVLAAVAAVASSAFWFAAPPPPPDRSRRAGAGRAGGA
jgi:MFS family permease